MYLPGLKASDKAFGLHLTFNELNDFAVKADGVIFILSGFLLILNWRKLGGFLLIIAMTFVLATKDNPWIESNVISIEKEKNQRFMDFLKNLSVIGAALLIMADKEQRK